MLSQRNAQQAPIVHSGVEPASTEPASTEPEIVTAPLPDDTDISRLPTWWEKLRQSDALIAYLLIAPALLVLIIYVFAPICYTLWISFQDVHLGVVPYTGAAGAQAGANGYGNPNAHNATTFFGFRNWVTLWTKDPFFTLALRNTVVMIGSTALLGVLAGLSAAVLVTRKLPFIGLFRTAYFFPAALSQVVTGLVFLWLFDENYGLVNHLLGLIGFGQIYWQDDSRYLLLSLILAASWITASYNLPIFAAALQNVPRVLREAAALDGANRRQSFWHVTVPTLRPVIWFVAISALVSTSQMLGLYDSMAQDTIETSTLVKYMFMRAFYYNDIDYAGAIGCVMIVALTIAALVGLWANERTAIV